MATFFAPMIYPVSHISHVGAAEGCDLLTLFVKNKIKRSQPSAAPTETSESSHATHRPCSALEPLGQRALAQRVPLRRGHPQGVHPGQPARR
ncbi:hypothetical protein EMIT0P395_10215 [Pseudomonas sp. IT-P395]